MRRAGLLLLAVLLLPSPALAQTRRCPDAPRPPLCLERLGSSSDAQAAAYCRAEVNAYRSQMTRYLDCLSDAIREGRRQLNQAERRLDCHARGGDICP